MKEYKTKGGQGRRAEDPEAYKAKLMDKNAIDQEELDGLED